MKNPQEHNAHKEYIEDFWNNCGETYGGYQKPTEVAFEIIEDEVRHYTRKMEQYKDLGMQIEEKAFCKGIIGGLLRYAVDGNNESHDNCPGDPYTIAENIIYDWRENHGAEAVEEI